MELANFIVPFIASNAKWKAAIENLCGQPLEHVTKCLNTFLDGVQSGPGLKDLEAEKEGKYRYIYEAGIKMGFADWESEIAAAGLAGYSPVDVAISFQKNRGWDVSAEKIEQLAQDVAPRFTKKAEQYGVIQKAPEPKAGTPKVQTKTQGGVPPWETNKQKGSGDAFAPSSESNKNAAKGE